MEQLLTRDYGALSSHIWEVLQDPASKPSEAILIFGIIALILLIVMFSGVIFILARTEDDEGVEGDSFVVATDATTSRPTRQRLSVGIAILGVVGLWWLVTGVTTAVPSVCGSCHADSAHATMGGEADPHGAVSCIKCHEAGGYVGALTVGVPARVVHTVSGMQSEQVRGSYGYVASVSCERCHAGDIADTTTNESKSVKVSHREPVEAGAQCLDCHRFRDGVVGQYTTKMTPCLRCHDDVQASADCSYCHVGDISLAISGRSQPSTATAQRLVPNPDCGGCHSQESCDACHGMRMPHTPEFMEYAHAREGVEDLWFNGGRTCRKCHNDDSRPCTECHQQFPSHQPEIRFSHRAATASGCDSCHAQLAYRPRRDFCIDLCHQD